MEAEEKDNYSLPSKTLIMDRKKCIDHLVSLYNYMIVHNCRPPQPAFNVLQQSKGAVTDYCISRN